ncbi:MAG TPA: RICIN domain-containing protein [Euzebyales bacterium]
MDDRTGDAIALFPPTPELLDELDRGDATERSAITDRDDYPRLIRSICGATDDSQPVEKYDGTLGVTTGFVADQERMVGQLQWHRNLATVYDDPGTVSGVRWCTGTLISHNLFLAAAHCFSQNPNGWRVPRINGTHDPIPSSEIARRMHVNFGYQVDPSGDLRTPDVHQVIELVEHRLDGLDVAILRLAGDPGSRFGIGRIAARDADVGDLLAIIGHPAGRPKRVEAGPLIRFDGHRIRYDDIDTLGGNSGSAVLQSPSGAIVGVHTNGGCNAQGTGSNFGVRVSRIRQASPTVRALDAAPLPLATGIHTIRQASSGRFVDAHEDASEDFSVVTRTAQDNDTQRWRFTPVATVVTMQQVSSDRYVDAHEDAAEDFSVVTRTAQHNDSQRWVVTPVTGRLSTYTLQQLSSGRYLDAHVVGGAADFSVVTRTAQDNDTQRWLLAPRDDGTFTVAQAGTGRRLDAHEHAGRDFSVVTRTTQDNDTQRWRITPVGAVYTIQQVSSGRFVDAHEVAGEDFSLVTRPQQGNDTQRWVVTYLGGNAHTLQQLSTARFVDAHEHAGEDFSVVTRTAQDNDTQRWLIDGA